MEGTNTFRLIKFLDIPQDRRKEIFHYLVVCEVKYHKEDPNFTRITVTGSQICYPIDVGTPTGSLDFVKLIINSVMSRRKARFVSFYLKTFYLLTLMEPSEYVRIKLLDIPQYFIKEYDLIEAAQNEWIYFEILRGCYGLPQSGRLANDLLRTRLEKTGYYEAATTPGLWSHKWRPINFFNLLTTSASDMWEKNTPSISSRLLSKTTRSPQTGKAQNLQ